MTQATTAQNDWIETTLGAMINVSSGKARPKNKGQFPVYGGNGILDYADDFNFNNDTVIVGRVGAYCGCVYLEKDKFWLSDNALGIKANEDSDIKFLYYFLVNENLNKKAIGGAQPLLTQGILNGIEVVFPPLPEQRAIAAMLSSLDDKIELLRNQNKTLESIAQQLFHEWFVEFNFPDAEGKPYKKNGGKMIGSELGEIPEGWEVKGLSEIADFLNGLALQKFPPESLTNYLPVIKIREMKSGISDQTDKASTNLDEKYVVHDGDILFSWSGSLEVVLWKYGKGALNQHLFKVTSKYYPKWFYYHWLMQHLEFFRMIASVKATTMGHIQRYHLDEAKVFIPTEDVMNKADMVFAPIFNKMIANNAHISSLTSARESLLPRMMAGEVRVNSFN